MADFLAMGGYAAYVWPAYALAAAVMAALLAATLTGLRRREALLRTLESGRPARGGRRRRERAEREPAEQEPAEREPPGQAAAP
jgi:heme exporter protein D